jgi:hypothetical protein
VKRAHPPYHWSDPAIVATNRGGSLHPRQLAAFRNRRIWWVFPLVLFFVMVPCSFCAWSGCNIPLDPFNPRGDAPTQWVCGNPADLGNLPRWILLAVGLAVALGAAITLLTYDRRYRARVLAGPITHSVGWVTFQATGPFMGKRYVAHTSGLTLKPPAGREDLPPPGAYTLFFEPTTGLLLSAEPLSTPASDGNPWSGSATQNTAQAIQQALAAGFPFTADDLDCNRAGALSDAQQKGGRTQWRAQVIGGLIFLLLMLAIAIPLGRGGLDLLRAGKVSLQALVSVAVAAVLLLALGWSAWQARTRLSGQRVAAYEGPVERSRVLGGEGPTQYFFHCGPVKLTVSAGAYEALVADYIYRIYYSPRLGSALSAEVIGQSTPLP